MPDIVQKELLTELFLKKFSRPIDQIATLPPSGSYRQYYRISSFGQNYIGAYNEDKAENSAFISFSKHFLQSGLPVPEIIAEELDNNIYIIQDLGDMTLLNNLQVIGFPNNNTAEAINLYKKVISQLPRFQIIGSKGLDYSKCYPRHAFDRQSMMWDLNYFKYYFLKLAKVPFNEQELENDFNTLCDFLLSADSEYFLYRDFQSRNIMLLNDVPYFIDYQGGRKGALQYDIASILFEAKTQLSPEIREILLEHYIQELSTLVPITRDVFMKHFYGFVLIRLMQAMGAYGFRGLYEKKELFLQSIPPALNHLEWILENITLPLPIPALTKVMEFLVESDYVRQLAKKHLILQVSINSFSYKRGIPIDDSSNGGGFVFDCRSIHNPGRYDRFKLLNGLDKPVQEFFENESEMENFLLPVYQLVSTSIDRYYSKGYTNLMVNFGCTGGQHRSVYAAEMIYKRLKEKCKDIDIVFKLRHRELEMQQSNLLNK